MPPMSPGRRPGHRRRRDRGGRRRPHVTRARGAARRHIPGVHRMRTPTGRWPASAFDLSARTGHV